MTDSNAFDRLRPMIEHRLSGDQASFRSMDNPGWLYRVSYRDGNFYATAGEENKTEEIMIDMNDYSEWFLVNVIDSTLAIGCE